MLDFNSLSDEEKQLVLHITDLIDLSDRHYKPYYSDFLNERQARLAQDVMIKNGISDYFFWGGYEGATRVMLCVYPQYMKPENSDFPMSCVNLKFRTIDELSHRDFLGSLMALGIKRDVIGDIVVGEGIASFFVKSDLEQYVKTQIRKIGRVGVTFVDYTADFEASVQNFEERECTVSSLRIDSVVGAMTKLSRSKAQQAVTSGLVARNFEVIYNTDCKICSGDKISVRGYGKFIVQFDGSMSKKGKYRISIKQFR